MTATQNYVEKLVAVFDTCEDVEATSDLHILYSIMKRIGMSPRNGHVTRRITCMFN